SNPAKARCGFLALKANVHQRNREHYTGTWHDMNNMADEVNAVIERFAQRKYCTTNEFNDLLLEIVGMASLNFCRTRISQGMSVEDLNMELQPYIAALGKWQRETLQQFMVFVDEPNAPTHTIN